MNFIKGLIGKVFPPYLHSLIRQEQGQVLAALINSLPAHFSEVKQQFAASKFMGLTEWKLFPDYKFVSTSFPVDTILNYKKNGQNYKIKGVQIFSKRANKYLEADLLFHNNILTGLKIRNSGYKLGEFDSTKVTGQNATKWSFDFPKSKLETFIDSLDESIKSKLKPDEIFDIDFGNRTYFAFYDMEDGNYLAVDKNQNVYSLIHDAKPMATKMKTTFLQALIDIQNGHFDIQRHLDERYSSSK
jgi:hypothetical protein